MNILETRNMFGNINIANTKHLDGIMKKKYSKQVEKNPEGVLFAALLAAFIVKYKGNITKEQWAHVYSIAEATANHRWQMDWDSDAVVVPLEMNNGREGWDRYEFARDVDKEVYLHELL